MKRLVALAAIAVAGVLAAAPSADADTTIPVVLCVPPPPDDLICLS